VEVAGELLSYPAALISISYWTFSEIFILNTWGGTVRWHRYITLDLCLATSWLHDLIYNMKMKVFRQWDWSICQEHFLVNLPCNCIIFIDVKLFQYIVNIQNFGYSSYQAQFAMLRLLLSRGTKIWLVC
jgi:hypothetical protein